MAKVFAVPVAVKYPKPDYKDYNREEEQAKEEKFFGELRQWLSDNNYKDKLAGKIVSFSVADGTADYMVVKEKPLTLFHLNLGDGYSIPPAHSKGLTLAEVKRMVEHEKFFTDIHDDNETFLRKQPVGAILHYDNGFGKAFVRQEVVLDGGKKKLKPIALVGEWQKHDLPFRYDDGSPYCPYHAKQVLDGELSTNLHTSTTYEAPNHANKGKGLDPRKLSPIDLALPVMTAEQADAAYLWELIKSLKDVLDNSEAITLPRDNPEHPRLLLKAAVDLLTKEAEAGKIC